MTYIYQNLLIIERKTTDENIINLTKKYNCWFENKPFEYKNDQDKIILFYPSNLLLHNKLVKTDTFSETIHQPQPVGVIKLYSSINQIKVFHIKFKTDMDLINNLKIFRKYLVETILNFKVHFKLDTIDKSDIKLFWDKDILNNKMLKQVLIEYKVLYKEDMYLFLDNNLYLTTTPVIKPNPFSYCSEINYKKEIKELRDKIDNLEKKF